MVSTKCYDAWNSEVAGVSFPCRSHLTNTVSAACQTALPAAPTLCALSSCFRATVLSLRYLSGGAFKFLRISYKEGQRSISAVYNLCPIDEDVLSWMVLVPPDLYLSTNARGFSWHSPMRESMAQARYREQAQIALTGSGQCNMWSCCVPSAQHRSTDRRSYHNNP